MLQGSYFDAASDVGRVESAVTAYRREKSNHDWTKRQLRAEKQARKNAEARAKGCEVEHAQRRRFFDRRLLHPVVSLPPDPWAVATMLATLIAIDRKTGFARQAVPGIRFARDVGLDLWSAPTETNSARIGDCAKFVRQEGAFRGGSVGCARLPRGFHVWLRSAAGAIIDVCVERGMPAPPASVYAAGVYAPIPVNPLKMPSPLLETPEVVESFDEAEMESSTVSDEFGAPGPGFDDVDDVDTAGVDELTVLSEDAENDVSGAASTAAAVVGLAGAIGGALTTAYYGQTAGAAVGLVANGAANLIGSMESQAPAKPSPRAPDKRAVDALHKQAVAKASAAIDPNEKLLAAALAAVTSDNPAILDALKKRLQVPRATDPNLALRMVLEAHLVGLTKSGYDVPIKHHRLRFSREMVEAARQRSSPVVEQPETFVEGVDLSDLAQQLEEPGCPGTCSIG